MPLGQVYRDVQRLGADALATAVGAYVLVGRPQVPQQDAWTYRTATGTGPPNVELTVAGLAMDMVCWLLRKKDGVRTFQDTLLLGRAPTNDLVVPDGSVSKLHARLHVEKDTVRLTDADSRNGTKLNGKRVDTKKGVTLKHQDVVGVGDVQMRYLDTRQLHTLLRGVKF